MRSLPRLFWRMQQIYLISFIHYHAPSNSSSTRDLSCPQALFTYNRAYAQAGQWSRRSYWSRAHHQQPALSLEPIIPCWTIMNYNLSLKKYPESPLLIMLIIIVRRTQFRQPIGNLRSLKPKVFAVRAAPLVAWSARIPRKHQFSTRLPYR